ncbi:MAG: glycosyltransferase [Actinomycetota bacterium]
MSGAREVLVLVLSYNRPHLIPVALDSVLSQTHDGLRILVADNGSGPDTIAVIEGYIARHPGRIELLRPARPIALSELLNRAFDVFRSSAAGYLALLADDDAWAPGKLERQLAVFDAEPDTGVVHTDATLIDDAGRPDGRLFSDVYIPRPEDSPERLLTDWNFVCGSSVLVRRDALEGVGPIPLRIRYSNDWYLWILIALLYGIRRIDEPLTLYRLTQHSLTLTRTSEMQWESVYLRRLAIRELGRRGVVVEGAEEAVAGQAFHTAVHELRTGHPALSLRIGWQSLRVGPRATARTWGRRLRRGTAKRIAGARR